MRKKLSFRAFTDCTRGIIDLGVVLMIGIAFVGMMVVSYIIYILWDQLVGAGGLTSGTEPYRRFNLMATNVTGGWDDAIALILVAVTIFILALAISALMLLKGR